MIAYKLVRKLKSGQISPLFINKTFRLPFNEWLEAESHPTKGFAYRKGWHCMTKPHAPHLTLRDRVWIEVEIEEYERYLRPESQGGLWALANKIKIIRELKELEINKINE